jgi:hypothetical protein
VNPPRWIDEEAVIRWVEWRLSQLRLEVERLDAYKELNYPPGLRRPIPPFQSPIKELETMYALMAAERERQWEDGGEQAAVEQALRGDLKSLGFLLRVRLGLEGDLRIDLSPETCHLILDFFWGRRSHKSGRPKGKKGRPKMSPAERRKRTRTHDAADFVPVIEYVLRHAYFERDNDQIYDLALKIAAIIKGIVRSETIADHRKRGPRDRHRAP